MYINLYLTKARDRRFIIGNVNIYKDHRADMTTVCVNMKIHENLTSPACVLLLIVSKYGDSFFLSLMRNLISWRIVYQKNMVMYYRHNCHGS